MFCFLLSFNVLWGLLMGRRCPESWLVQQSELLTHTHTLPYVEGKPTTHHFNLQKQSLIFFKKKKVLLWRVRYQIVQKGSSSAADRARKGLLTSFISVSLECISVNTLFLRPFYSIKLKLWDKIVIFLAVILSNHEGINAAFISPQNWKA